MIHTVVCSTGRSDEAGLVAVAHHLTSVELSSSAYDGSTPRLPEEPTLALFLGDRIEALQAAINYHRAGYMIGHIHGGEVTRGSQDNAYRHALSQLAHIHFVAHRLAATVLYDKGVDPSHIHITGAPALYYLHPDRLLRDANSPAILLHYNPNTIRRSESVREFCLLVETVLSLGEQAIIVRPNKDPGCGDILDVASSYADKHPGLLSLAEPLSPQEYYGLLNRCRLLLGNTSAGIIEGGYLGVPFVLVGDRQDGRLRSSNVRRVEWEQKAIASSIRAELSPTGVRRFPCSNLYGTAVAASKIATIISEMELKHV